MGGLEVKGRLARVDVVEVTALWRPGATRAELRAAAHDHLRVRVTRLCPRCGSTDHGRPHARGTHLSLAYAPGVVVVARAGTPVGVDVEPGPRSTWTRLEAVLKCTGEGLVREQVGSDEEEGVHTRPLPLPAGWTGSVATRRPARLSWAEVGAPGRGATG